MKQKDVVVGGMYRYGYYIPSKNVHGMDQELAGRCQTFYETELGLIAKHAEHFDGVSVLESNGRLVFRVTLQNFFADFYDVRVFDYEYISA
jgi:hypothetical protein